MHVITLFQAIIQRIASRISYEGRRFRPLERDFHTIYPPFFFKASRRRVWEVTTIWLRRALVVVIAAVAVLAAALSVQLAQGGSASDPPAIHDSCENERSPADVNKNLV